MAHSHEVAGRLCFFHVSSGSISDPVLAITVAITSQRSRIGPVPTASSPQVQEIESGPSVFDHNCQIDRVSRHALGSSLDPDSTTKDGPHTAGLLRAREFAGRGSSNKRSASRARMFHPSSPAEGLMAGLAPSNQRET